MNVAILTKDERLLLKLTNSTFLSSMTWESYITSEELFKDEVIVKYQYVLISDRLMDIEHYQECFFQLREKHPQIKIIFLISNSHRSSLHTQYMQLCELYQIEYVLPGRGREAIVEQIHRIMDGNANQSSTRQRGRIICCIGTTPNIGTTTISLGIATILAQESSEHIGYLCLNLKSSKLHRYLGLEDRRSSLDELRAELKAQSLSPDRLLMACECMEEMGGLHVLIGNMHREQADFFSSEEIEHLLSVAKQTFDICIVDVNAYWDNAGTVCSMIEADARVVITTTEITHFQEDMKKWIIQVGSVFGITPQHVDLVVAQTDKKLFSQGISLKDIQKETQMRIMATVRRQDKIMNSLNRGRIMDIYQVGHPVRADISTIAHQFIDRYRLPRKAVVPNKRWPFAIWGKV